MKRANENLQVQKTAERNGLWHALTPQMFRLDLLIAALLQALGPYFPEAESIVEFF